MSQPPTPPPNSPRPPMTDVSPRGPLDRTARLSMRTRTYTARTIAECLQKAKLELGVEAMIVSKKTFRKGALFGRWGGREMVEVTFGTYRPPSVPGGGPNSIVFNPIVADPARALIPAEIDAPVSSLQKLEAQIAGLTESVQNLLENGAGKAPSAFVTTPVEARILNAAAAPPAAEADTAKQKAGRPAKRMQPPAVAASDSVNEPGAPYPGLLRQLLDAEVAAPLARQLINELPEGLAAPDAAAALRTLLAQRLLIASRLRTDAGSGLRLLAILGSTGVGKTTTIVKLAAQYAVLERRRVGIVTLDTHRIAAAQQLQMYGQILKVPVKIANNKPELIRHLSEMKAQEIDIVLIDTAGRSPNDMVPLGETAELFDGMGAVRKYLAIPATMAARDMEHIVARFQSLVAPDSLIMTKLDEATDNACFGKLLTVQAKSGLPLAYVTTGQRVPDDIMYPDAHAIAARILTTAVL